MAILNAGINRFMDLLGTVDLELRNNKWTFEGNAMDIRYKANRSYECQSRVDRARDLFLLLL